MWKLIFLGLIIWFAIYFLKRAISQSNKPTPNVKQPDTKESAEDTTESTVENMVQCATCQIHLPRSEAFLVNGNFYCCKAHIG